MERVGEGTLYIAYHSWYDANDTVCHNSCGKFATSQYVVSNRDLTCHEVFPDTIVYALVVAADDYDILFQAQFVRHSLIKGLAIGSGKDNFIIMTLCLEGRNAGIQWLTLNEHTCSASIGVVIYAAPFVSCIVTQVMDMYLGKSLLLGTSENTLIDKA